MVMNAVKEFHKHYDKERIWSKNTFLGIPCWKLPFDMNVYQEIIFETKPDFIIETGTGHGGSSLFLASICELIGQGEVITIDIDMSKKDSHEWGNFIWEDRIHYICGSSVDSDVYNEVKNMVGNSKCLLILDSWHKKEFVYQEMLLYSKFVNVGSYMIVEDSHVNGNPIEWQWGDGPMEAIVQWIDSYCNSWEIDTSREKHIMTFNPCGYIKRIK
jgi:cephalosporin hydroxylase